MSIMPCIVMSAQFSCTACTQVKSLGYGQVTSAARACSTWDLLPRRSVLNTAKCAQPCSADARLYYQAHPHMYRRYNLLFTSCCRCTFHPTDMRAPCFQFGKEDDPGSCHIRNWINPLTQNHVNQTKLTFNTVQPSPCSISYLSQTNMHDWCFTQPDISNRF